MLVVVVIVTIAPATAIIGGLWERHDDGRHK